MRSSRIFLPILAMGLGLAACSDDSPNGFDDGRLTVQLTDAPGDLAEAWVKIESVVLIGSPVDTSASGRLELDVETDGYINLLTLAGGKVMDLVDDAEVPEGSYSEMRLVIDEAYVELKDGRVYATSGADVPTGTTVAGTLKCPSCSQSGFKVKFTNGLTVGANTVALIDFDVAQSFGHEAGNSGQWIMRPVLRATTEAVRLGVIRGNVTLATGLTLPAACGGAATSITQFKPIAVLSGDTLSGTVDAQGNYRIANAMPGLYALGAIGDISFTNGDTLTYVALANPLTVTLPQGDSVTSNYQITAAVCH